MFLYGKEKFRGKTKESFTSKFIMNIIANIVQTNR